MRSYPQQRSRGRLQLRLLGRRAVVPAVTVLPQLVPIAAVGYLIGHHLPVVILAGLLTAAFFAALDKWRIEPRSRAHLYLALWPFFAWWAACVTLSALAPIALIGAAFAGKAETWLAASAISAAVGVAAVSRTPRLTHVHLALPDLPPAFEGYRIAHISDVHCGVFAPERRVRDWVRRANATRADLIAITGDLIVSGTDYVPAVASALGQLRAPDGVFACMGNHDYFGTGEALVEALRGRGICVLRNEHRLVRRGDDALTVAGVDDTWTRRDDMDRALAGRRPDGFTLLLSHDPDLFPDAAARGVQLTLSGHTHGGQLAVPFAARRFNLARMAHTYTSGLYREQNTAVFVNRGAGTTGPPVRIGTRGEIALITLVRLADSPHSAANPHEDAE